MPAFTIPTYPERRLREFNKAHEPKGTADKNNDGKGDGGQFAHKDGLAGMSAADIAADAPLDASDVDTDAAWQKSVDDAWANSSYAANAVAEPADPTAPPIMQGVDPESNAVRMVAESIVPKDLQAGLAAELAEMPLIHGTSVTGAVAAATEGLQSFKDLEDDREELQVAMDDIRDAIEERLGPAHGVEAWTGMTGEDIRQGFPHLDRSAAEEAAALFAEMIEIERVIAGKTFKADAALGLDEYVFMTHGEKHQDYGDVGVILDNNLLQAPGTIATPEDIVRYSARADPEPGEDEDTNYARAAVHAYRQDIVNGTDYIQTAAADNKLMPIVNGTSGAYGGQPISDPATVLATRNRDHLWEIKVPRVPSEAVRGFVVTSSIEDAQRLRDKLGRKGDGTVLYIDTSNGEAHGWLQKQLQFVQSQGYWDQGAVEDLDDQTGNSGSVILF